MAHARFCIFKYRSERMTVVLSKRKRTLSIKGLHSGLESARASTQKLWDTQLPGHEGCLLEQP